MSRVLGCNGFDLPVHWMLWKCDFNSVRVSLTRLDEGALILKGTYRAVCSQLCADKERILV